MVVNCLPWEVFQRAKNAWYLTSHFTAFWIAIYHQFNNSSYKQPLPVKHLPWFWKWFGWRIVILHCWCLSIQLVCSTHRYMLTPKVQSLRIIWSQLLWFSNSLLKLTPITCIYVQTYCMLTSHIYDVALVWKYSQTILTHNHSAIETLRTWY